MKMAKASERDIDAAGDLMALLNDIDSGYYPARADDEDAPTFFDEDDKDHLRLFYDKAKVLLDRAPGFQGRVIGGMCYVIMYDKNEIIDPNADVIELHPKLQAALEAAERVKELERQLAERDAQEKQIGREPTDAMQAAGTQAIRFDTTLLNKMWTANAVFRAMWDAAIAAQSKGGAA